MSDALNQTLYFFNLSDPSTCIGTAVFDGEKFISTSSNVASGMVQSARDRYTNLGFPAPSDSEVYHDLNGWTNGVLCIIDRPQLEG